MQDTREAQRLADKVDAVAWVEQYLTPHLSDATTILDVGCGPGAIVNAAARVHTTRHFTGIDLVGDRFALNVGEELENVSLKVGNAIALPFADCSFDFVICRFLLEYLPDRERAVHEMVRVCKPYGRILLQDLDGQLVWHYPEDLELNDQLHRVLTELHSTGFDPFVGRKLFSFAQNAGLRDIKVRAESYHLFAGKIDKENDRLWTLKLDIALPTIAKILGSDNAAQSLRVRFLKYLRRDDTLTYSVMFSVLGQKQIST